MTSALPNPFTLPEPQAEGTEDMQDIIFFFPKVKSIIAIENTNPLLKLARIRKPRYKDVVHALF